MPFMEYFDAHPRESKGGAIVGKKTVKRIKLGQNTTLQPGQVRSTKGPGPSTSRPDSLSSSSIASSSRPSASSGSTTSAKEKVQARLNGQADKERTKASLSKGDLSKAERTDRKGKAKDNGPFDVDAFPLAPLLEEKRRLDRAPTSSQESIGYKPKKDKAKEKRLKRIEEGGTGDDSDDPLGLTQSSVDVGRSLSPVPSTKKKKRPATLVSSSPVDEFPLKLTTSKGSNRDQRSASATSTSPERRQRKGATMMGKDKGAKSAAQKKDDEGEAFFRELELLSQEDRKAMREASPNAKIAGSVAPETDRPAAAGIGDHLLVNMAREYGMEGMTLEDDTLTSEEREYCKDFIDMDDICKYCGMALPLTISCRLSSLKDQLSIIEQSLAELGQTLPWTRTVEFCSLHTAETTVIPLGYRRGYPKEIDFTAVPDRLEEEWVRQDLEVIMSCPPTSSFYRQVMGGMDKMGKWRWLGMQNQAQKDVVDPTIPGYYGQTGRAVIMRYFENLYNWGLLPHLSSASGKSSIAPLEPTEFISHVLVPEAGVRLIMADKGWEGVTNDAGYQAAVETAVRLREESVPFGRGRFPADGQSAVKWAGDQEFKSACVARRAIAKGDKEDLVEVEEISDDEEENTVPVMEISSDDDDILSLGTPSRKRKTVKKTTKMTNEYDTTDDDTTEKNHDTMTKKKILRANGQRSPIHLPSSPTPPVWVRPFTPENASSQRKLHVNARGFSRTDSARTDSTYGMGDDEFQLAMVAVGERYD